MKNLFTLVLLALLSLSSAAQNTIAQNAGIWAAVSGNSTTMGMGANGAVTLATGIAQGSALSGQAPVNLSGWTTAGNYGVAPGATGVTVGSTANMGLPAGRSLPVTVSSLIKPSSLGAGLKFLAKNAPFLGTGIAVYDLIKEIGFDASKNSDGTLTVTKLDATACTVAPCFNYRAYSGYPWAATKEIACTYAAAQFNAGVWGSGYNVSGAPNTAGTLCVYTGTKNGAAWSGSDPISTTPVSPVANPWLPSSEQALQDYIAAKSGWPTSASTKVDEAVRDAIQSGQTFEVNTPTVTGPASVAGPTNTTTTPAQNGQLAKSTATADTYNITYNNNVVNVITTTTTTVNDGTTTTTSTSTAEPAPESDLCKLHPESAGCTPLGAAPVAETIPSLNVPVTITPISFAAPTGCPVPYSGTITVLAFVKPWSFTFTPMCDLMTTLRPLFLALGAFAAAWLFMEGLKA